MCELGNTIEPLGLKYRSEITKLGATRQLLLVMLGSGRDKHRLERSKSKGS